TSRKRELPAPESGLGRMHPQSTDGWALRLHSCRALSSQLQAYLTRKGQIFEVFPLTNHIPVFRGSFNGMERAEPRRKSAARNLNLNDALVSLSTENGGHLSKGAA